MVNARPYPSIYKYKHLTAVLLETSAFTQVSCDGIIGMWFPGLSSFPNGAIDLPMTVTV